MSVVTFLLYYLLLGKYLSYKVFKYKTNDTIDNCSMRIRKGRLSKSEKIQDKMRRSISEEITNESIRPRFSRLSFKKQQKVSFK